MAIHPELEHAIKTELPIPELINVFAKHYSGLPEDFLHGELKVYNSITHDNNSFWDMWKPLGLWMDVTLLWAKPIPIEGPSSGMYKGLTQEIILWLSDSERNTSIYLIAEPLLWLYTTGYFPRAAVLAAICDNVNQLGAWPYLSVAGISAQLATQIHKLPTRIRFKKLVHEPWQALRESHPQYIAAPPVIVLCHNGNYLGEEEELFYIICEFCSSKHSSPLLWIISIDRNLRFPICNLLNPLAPFGFTRLPVCYDDGPADAVLILHHQFSVLRQKYEEVFDKDEKWPSDEQTAHLIRIISGAPESLNAIFRFMGREDGGGPKAHLETFLTYMANSPSPSDKQPYCALDHFYTQMFSNIPHPLLPIANQVLNILHYPSYPISLTPFQIACLLFTGESNILSICGYLSGWAIIVGAEGWYRSDELLRDFLEEPKRSGQLWNNSESGLICLETLLHFLNCSSNPFEFLKSRVQLTPAHPATYIQLEDLRHRVSGTVRAKKLSSCRAFLEQVATLRFNFHCLTHMDNISDTYGFWFFLCNLYDLEKPKLPTIVRVRAVSPLDRQFIDKCEGLAEPLDFESRQFPQRPKYVLLGFGNETVLVLFEGGGESYKERWGTRVEMYTSAMLDLM